MTKTEVASPRALKATLALALVVLLAGLLPLVVSLAAGVLFGHARHVQEPLHEWFELVGTCIALGVAMLLLMRTRHEEASRHLFWVAAALIAMGLVDGLHAVHGISLRSWQRHGATLIGGLLFGLVWVPLPPAVTRRRGLFLFIVAGPALALGLWWGSESMPVTWDPVGLYTLPVKAANGLGGLGFLSAALFFSRRYLRQPRPEDLVFASQTVLFGVASLLFGLSHTWAADWWVWHGSRLIAYAIVLATAYETVVALYEHAARHAQDLASRVQERTAELATANAALRESEERNRTTLYSIGDAVIATDADGRLSWMNPVAEKLTGWPEAEARGKLLHEVFRIVNEETRAEVESPVARVLREGLVVGLANHTLLIAKDGSERPIADSGAPIRNENSETIGVVLVFRDQTEDRAAQKALQESERRFHDALRYLDEGYYRCAVDGVLQEHNVAFNSILGFDSDQDLKGSMLPDFWQHPEDRKEYLTELMSKGIVRNFLINAKTIGGDKLVVMANAHLVKDENGTPVRIEGTFTDFTERKRVEEALTEARDRLEEAQRVARLGNWEWDAVKDEINGSEEFYRLFDVAPEGIARFSHFMDRLHPDDRERVQCDVADALRQDRAYDTDYRVKLRDGGWRDINARGRVIPGAAGEPVRMVGICMDITERKRAEAELRVKNQVFEDSIASQSVADRDGVITLVNPAFLRLWGYADKEQALGKSVGSFFADPADATPVLEALAGRDAWEGEFLACRTDGTTFVSRGFATSMRNAAGELIGYQSTNLDVTGARESEAALRESEERFRATFDQAAVGFAQVGLDGRWLRVNQRLCAIIGYTGDELLALTFQDITHPDDLNADLEYVRQILAGEMQTYSMEKRYIRKDRSLVWIYLTVGLVRDEVGAPKYFVSVVEDIAERKRAEEALAESEEKLRTLFETMSEGIVYEDHAGNIISANPAAERLLGLSLDQMQGRTSLDPRWKAIHEDGSPFPGETHSLRVAAMTGKPGHDEIQGIYNPTSGAYVWLSVNSTPEFLPGEKEPYRAYAVFRDITERKQAERQLTALNESLARSNQELEQFAYVASHDLQEPLRMVSSYTQLLAQRYKDKLDQDAKDFIGYAVDGANRMQRLIQDLLEYSRVTTRGQPPAALDAHDALGEAVRNLQAAIQEAGALVTNDELPLVRGDHTQVVQVFQNLVGNGIKFHKPGEPPRVHLSAERNLEQPGFWTFKVADNGIGIAPRHFERLFVIFQRLHGKQEYPGTGIGLAMCKRIVERHGGKIWIESEAGKGTTIFFTLPSAGRGEGAQR